MPNKVSTNTTSSRDVFAVLLLVGASLFNSYLGLDGDAKA